MIDVAFEGCKFHILSAGDGIRFVKKRTTGAVQKFEILHSKPNFCFGAGKGGVAGISNGESQVGRPTLEGESQLTVSFTGCSLLFKLYFFYD